MLVAAGLKTEHYFTSWMAVLMSMGPEAGAAAGASSPSTSDMMSSLMDRQGVKSETNQQDITYIQNRTISYLPRQIMLLKTNQ